jgi:hypothetical protein
LFGLFDNASSHCLRDVRPYLVQARAIWIRFR